jgi:hypothetical protein
MRAMEKMKLFNLYDERLSHRPEKGRGQTNL